MKVLFSSLGLDKKFKYPHEAREIIERIVKEESKQLGEISIVFTDNQHILKINKRYLKHSYYTDVITFENNVKGRISGDIFISTEQVQLNSIQLGTNSSEELFRVIIHGILHLIGYTDEYERDREEMHRKEDTYLNYLEVSIRCSDDEFMV